MSFKSRVFCPLVFYAMMQTRLPVIGALCTTSRCYGDLTTKTQTKKIPVQHLTCLAVVDFVGDDDTVALGDPVEMFGRPQEETLGPLIVQSRKKLFIGSLVGRIGISRTVSQSVGG